MLNAPFIYMLMQCILMYHTYNLINTVSADSDFTLILRVHLVSCATFYILATIFGINRRNRTWKKVVQLIFMCFGSVYSVSYYLHVPHSFFPSTPIPLSILSAFGFPLFILIILLTRLFRKNLPDWYGANRFYHYYSIYFILYISAVVFAFEWTQTALQTALFGNLTMWMGIYGILGLFLFLLTVEVIQRKRGICITLAAIETLLGLFIGILYLKNRMGTILGATMFFLPFISAFLLLCSCFRESYNQRKRTMPIVEHKIVDGNPMTITIR